MARLPGARSASIDLEDFPQVDRFVDADLVGTWERLLAVRETVNAALEDKRKQKIIGNALGARVMITARGPVAALLDTHREHLPMLFNVSDLALHLGPLDGADDVQVRGREGAGGEMRRCWRSCRPSGTEPDWAGICDRCRGRARRDGRHRVI